MKPSTKYVYEIYLKNKDELVKYLIQLQKEKNGQATLEDVHFDFKWGHRLVNMED